VLLRVSIDWSVNRVQARIAEAPGGPPYSGLVPIALSNGEVILVVVLAVIPIAAITFALGAGTALSQVGKGRFAVEFDHDLEADRDGGAAEESQGERAAEIRQMLEAKAFRQSARGQTPVDVEAELERLLRDAEGTSLASDRQLVEEVRQLTLARNERRLRQGKEPLDVEAEVERRLRELEDLGG
jgi:hypothetical protein